MGIRCFARSFMLVTALAFSLGAMSAYKKQSRTKAIAADTASVTAKLQDVRQGGKMVTSPYPVRIQVTMNAVQVQSDRPQLLPIYTRNGMFYMAARLNKGVTWINGLPRGHYFINNRPVTIN